MTKYKHLFFDLDHTLWDYDTNAAESLTELHYHHQLEERSGFSAEQLVNAFIKANELLWNDYNLSKIGREDIRKNRFPMIYQMLDADLETLPEGIEDQYITLCPSKSATFPFAHQVLDDLKGRYQLHLITNGFDDIQSTKMKSAGLADYFDLIVTSETAGFRKPETGIFEFALNQTGARRRDSLMIGDNLVADIGGARNYGIDQVFFNPKRISHNDLVTFEISSLNELVSFL